MSPFHMAEMAIYLTAFTSSAILALMGLFLQRYFQNPLVDPYILGIQSGAQIGIILWAYFFYSFSSILFTPFMFSFLGSSIVLLLLLILQKKFSSKYFPLIYGFLVSQFLSLINFFFEKNIPYESQAWIRLWGQGSFYGASLTESIILFFLFCLSFGGLFIISTPLEMFLFGDQFCKSLGVPLHLIKKIGIFLTALITAYVTSVVGPLSFVGLVVPNMVALLFPAFKIKWKIFATSLLGGTLGMLAQLMMEKGPFVGMSLNGLFLLAFFLFLGIQFFIKRLYHESSR